MSALTGIWAALLCLTGGFHLDLGIIRISSRAPRSPLLLSLVSGLLAWAVSLNGERRAIVRGAGIGRYLRFGALMVVMTAGLNVLLMTAPAPPPEVHNCLFLRELNWGFRHILNCDSPEFLAVAQTPSMILSPAHQNRQSRPLAAGLPYVVAEPLRHVRWITESDIYRPYAAEFLAFALINLTLMGFGLSWIAWLLESGDAGAQPGIELLVALVVLSTNDLTKLFMWTPHTQIFNLFVSCLTLYLTFRLIDRRQPLSVQQGVLLSLGLGIGSLAYGSFLITVAAVVVVQGAVYRKFIRGVAYLIVSFIPYAGWVAYVRWRTGQFYSHEVDAYRQFVWIADCVKLGADACLPIVTNNAWTFLNTAAPIVFPVLVAIFCCRLARLCLPAVVQLPEAGRAIALAVAITLAITTAFLGLMGFYVPRLCWLLIPPLLLVLAYELQAFRLSLRSPNGWGFKAVMLGCLAVYVAILLARQGPYK